MPLNLYIVGMYYTHNFLKFFCIGERTKELTQNLHIKNISDKSVAYKFLTTEPLHTLIRPNQGLIDPNCENDIIGRSSLKL